MTSGIEQAVRIWPWSLTLLTAQVMGAIFALGSAGLGVLADRRWTSARILFQVAAVMLVLILIGGARAYGEFDPSSPMTWLLGAEFTAGLATTTILYARMRARAGQASRDTDTGAEPGPGALPSPIRGNRLDARRSRVRRSGIECSASAGPAGQLVSSSANGTVPTVNSAQDGQRATTKARRSARARACILR